jgi:neutral ceramidase
MPSRTRSDTLGMSSTAWFFIVLGIASATVYSTQGALAAPQSLFAGASQFDLKPPQGVPLAGYGGGKRRHLSPRRQNDYAHMLSASRGVHDPVFAKTLYLRTAHRDLVLVGLDLIAITRDFRRDLARRLSVFGLREEDLILTATHTHSGPGCLSRSHFWQIVAADRFSRKIYDQFIDTVYQSILKARSELRPAKLGVTQVSMPGFTANRRKRPELDPVATLIRVDAAGGSVGTVLNFPVHGTVLGTKNLLLSADLPGAMAQSLQLKTGGVVVFVNGALGDVSPVTTVFGSEAETDFDRIMITSQNFSDAIYPAWAQTPTRETVALDTTEKEVPLPKPRLNLGACANQRWLMGLPGLSLGRLGLPRKALLKTLTINNHLFVMIPGEPITKLGLDIKALGREAGYSTTSTFGLANDHLGYILTRDEYRRGGYEVCGSLYGSRLGERIIEGVRELVAPSQP